MGNERIQDQQKDDSDLGPHEESAPPEKKSFGPKGQPSAQGALTHDKILRLQRAIGNRAVNRLVQAKLKVSSPQDEYEREADQVAERALHVPKQGDALQRQATDEEERKRPEEEDAVQMKRGDASELVHRQAMNLAEDEERKKRPEQIQAKEDAGGEIAASPDVESQIDGLRGGGDQLPDDVRADFETQLGQDFSKVRLHKGAQAADAAEAINARAYTKGTDVVFAAGQYAPETSEGKKLLAHELTHVVQQGGAGERVQRYEAGEHAKLGETQDELKQAFAPTSYVVQKGEKLRTIADRFGITVAELKAANKDKLRQWPASDGSGRMIEGFNAGETISIPQQLNDLAKAATKDKSATFTVNGVVLEYGVGIALGDLFESPEQMANASPKELKDLAALIKREQVTGKLVEHDEWEKASGGRYLKLAEKNVAHFAPQNATRVKPSAAGAAGPNHKSEWEKYHAAALAESVAGNKDKALMTNAFADHFLTDAFAAGHLINKPDVMEAFKSQLKLDAQGNEFTEDSKKFFDSVANDAFTGSVKTEFSKYETYEAYSMGWHPDIDSPSRFSSLLQGIHKEEPDLLANAVAKGVHDRLNKLPGGLPVENAKGDPPWKLSGDETLNNDTLKVVRKAVAQSQMNVISVYKMIGPLDTPSMFSRVWDYTPRPSVAGLKQLVEEVKKGSDIAEADLRKAVVTLIQRNYLLIIGELVARKKLKLAT
jgi:Domain of unknown function (DUF4157)/LysM domain